jgi:3-oxoacyl-[acyl-carrier-protein] synthase II
MNSRGSNAVIGPAAEWPPINYETPAPPCDLDDIPHEAREGAERIAVSPSFGFGGHNACLVLRRFEG